MPGQIKKADGSRSYQKKDICLFCKKIFLSKILPHYIAIHYKEDRVQAILQKDKKSKERNNLCQILQNEGNHQHNLKVLQSGVGELAVNRRPTKTCQMNADQYLPCVECHAWCLRKNLRHHAISCPAGKPLDPNYIRNGEVLISQFLPPCENEDMESLIGKLRNTKRFPDLVKTIEDDNLIKSFCNNLIQRLGPNEEQRKKDQDTIRGKLRAIARLLQMLRNQKITNKSLFF